MRSLMPATRCSSRVAALRPAPLASALIVAALVAGGSWTAPAAAAGGPTFYVSPSGSDTNPGTASQPVQTVQRAQQLVRSVDQGMTADVTVVIEDGFYRLTAPLALDPSDSGTNGHDVVWTAAPGARPVFAGSVQVTDWTEVGSSGIWTAQGPSGIRTRQLYVDGRRAVRATGPVPSAATLASWRDPSGQWPPEVEFVYKAGAGKWTEPRCPVASVSGGVVNMAQPCWANSTQRGNNHVGPASVGAPTSAENAYQLLTSPGMWYLDTGSSRFYYMPKAGESPATMEVEAPVLEALVKGGGTASNPLHNVVFDGIQFSYATWMGASSPTGFSEIQANYLNQGPTPTSGNPSFVWYQIPADVSLTYDQSVQFTNDAFVHLGGAGLGLGDGSQNDLVQGNVLTDTSGNALELGNVDLPNATGASQTIGNTIQDNWVTNAVTEFQGGIGIDVGYAANTVITHNQVDDLPYSGMSIGWGGWGDKVGLPGLANYSQDNVVSNNVLFNTVSVLGDGAAIYSNGRNGSAWATGEHLTGNVIHDMKGVYYFVNNDNGTDWVTVTGNAMWNPGPAADWGWCHKDYYPGEGGGYDHFDISANWWVVTAPGPGASGGAPNCQAVNNTAITGPSQVPASVLDAAGLEASYQGLLNWQQVLPSSGCAPMMSAPTGATATAAGGGVISVSWASPAADCSGPASGFAIYGYSAATQTGSIQVSLAASTTFSGLAPGSYYIFTITAWDGRQWTGWSAWSTWVLAT